VEAFGAGKGDSLTSPSHTIRLRNDAMAGQAPRAGLPFDMLKANASAGSGQAH